jgi:HEAT repeat protein
MKRTLSLGVFALLLALSISSSDSASQQDSPARQQAQEMLKGIKGQLHLDKPAKDVLRSLMALEEVADEVRRTHQQLVFLLGHRDPAVRRQAAQTLAAISGTPDEASSTVTHLTKKLHGHEPDPDVSAAILMALARMGPHAKPAVPTAMEALKNPDPRIRRGAVIMIGCSAAYDKDLIPAVISALDDPDLGAHKDKPGLNSVSMLAMFQLQLRKAEAKDAAPKLVRLAKDNKGDAFYQLFVLNTLAYTAPEEALPLNTARDWLKRKERPEDIIKGAGLLARLGRHGKAAVPDLIAVLEMVPLEDRNLEHQTKTAAISALKSIGPAAKDALPVLRAMTATPDLALRFRLLDAIKSVEGNE